MFVFSGWSSLIPDGAGCDRFLSDGQCADARPVGSVPHADEGLLGGSAVDDSVQDVGEGTTAEAARSELEGLLLVQDRVGDNLQYLASLGRNDPEVLS